MRLHPYPARIFALPRTHTLEHSAPDDDTHLNFHLWALSFLTGMRRTATEAGFLDATPIKPGKLVDFVLIGKSLANGIHMAEDFWIANRTEPKNAQRYAGAIHALFLAQNPRLLQFEEFI